MNNVVLIGRLTKEPEIRYSNSDTPVAYGNYTLAVDRPTRGERITDFIMCKVVGKDAEFAEKHLKKGMKIAVRGSIQVDTWQTQNGTNARSTYVQVDRHEFCESKTASAPNADFAPTNESVPNEFQNRQESIDDDLESDGDLPF